MLLSGLPSFSVYILVGVCGPQERNTHCVAIKNFHGTCYLAEAIEQLLNVDGPWHAMLQNQEGTSVAISKDATPTFVESATYSTDDVRILGSLKDVLEGASGRTILSPVSSDEDPQLKQFMHQKRLEGEGLFYVVYFILQVC
jgi:hypothetical protein